MDVIEMTKLRDRLAELLERDRALYTSNDDAEAHELFVTLGDVDFVLSIELV